MTDYTGLTARLARGLQWAEDGWPVSGTSEDMEAAADAIAALVGERDALREALFVYGDRSKMSPALAASLEAYGKANPTRHADRFLAALRTA